MIKCRYLSVLLAASVGFASQAVAKGMLTAPIADWNSAQISQNGYLVTVPYGALLSNAVYTVTNGTSLQVSSRFTVTLPSGFTFNSTPSLSIASGGASLLSGGIGFEYATFNITSNTIGTVVINEFAMQVPTSFASQFGGNILPLTVQATNNAIISNNDAAPVTVPAFTHAVGSLPDTITPGSGHIDLAFPFYGNQFVPSGATVEGSGLVATFAINTEYNDPFNSNAPVLSANGTANHLNPSDTADITVDGVFEGIGSGYASTTITTCQTTPPVGSHSLTITSTSISMTNIPVNTPIQICVIPDNVMWEASVPYVYTYEASAGVTDYFGGLSQTTFGNYYTYSPAPTITIVSGTPQKTQVNTAFSTLMSVKVTDSTSHALSGINVTFATPGGSGPSGFFAGNFDVGTDLNGVATQTVFTANSVACAYAVKANVGASVVLFDLLNEPKGITDMIFCQGFQ